MNSKNILDELKKLAENNENVTNVNVANITVDPAFQIRERLSEEIITELAEKYQQHDYIAPIHIIDAGNRLIVVNGFTRVAAIKRTTVRKINAVVIKTSEIYSLGLRLFHNSNNDQNFTKSELKSAVAELLKNEEFSRLSDRQLARNFPLSDKTIAKIRPETSAENPQIRTVTRNGVEFPMDTSEIGGKQENTETSASSSLEEQKNTGDKQFDVKKSNRDAERQRRRQKLLEKWNVKNGDKYNIYDSNNKCVHKIICGDSQNRDTYDSLFEKDELTTVIVTDVPYNVDVRTGARKTPDSGITIVNDDISDVDYENLLTNVFNECCIRLISGGCYYIFSPTHNPVYVDGIYSKTLGKPSQDLIWYKSDRHPCGFSKYRINHERCVFGWKKDTCNWHGNNSQTTVFEERVDRKSENALLELHPTPKPLKMLEQLIRNSSQVGDLVLDPFAGSGSTIVAAHNAERRSCAIELDPAFVALILERLSNLGLTPKLNK
ncbi:MAG: DNA modification methylase [Aridibacter sp.]